MREVGAKPKTTDVQDELVVPAKSEFKRQIELLLKLGVIRPSRAGYYSHGFMVPKPGGKMRL